MEERESFGLNKAGTDRLNSAGCHSYIKSERDEFIGEDSAMVVTKGSDGRATRDVV